MLIGKAFDDFFVHFETKAPWWAQLIKLVVGFLIVIGLRFGLKKLFGGDNETALLHGVRYLIMTVAAVGIYPLLFRVFRQKQRA